MKPKLNIIGHDGNAFAIFAKAKKVAEEHGMEWEPIQEEATQGDYDHLLQTMMKHFEVS